MSALTKEGQAELRRFGWELGSDFERRYMEDAWVFNLANAVEVVARERDEARAALADCADDVPERAEPEQITAAWGLTEAQWLERVQSASDRADTAEAERDENEAAFKVWRRRCEAAEAERDEARAALEWAWQYVPDPHRHQGFTEEWFVQRDHAAAALSPESGKGNE